MPTADEIEVYRAGLGDAVAVVRSSAAAAGLDAPVPTCPGWTVRDLVLHLGTVQRWATGVLGGADPGTAGAAAGTSAAAVIGDPLDWLEDGVVDLLATLVATPADAAVFFFLENAPAPRTGWARRQCHEATVHAVDALSAQLGGAPAAARTWIGRDLALDGVDELLRGFLPRRRQRVRSETPLTALVRPDDDPSGGGWLLRISTEPVRSTRLAGGELPEGVDVTIGGTAVGLYLGLWNRGEEFTVTGGDDFVPRWREQMRIVWS